MKKGRKRKVLWGLLGGLLGLTFLFVVVLLLLPHFVNVKGVKARIMARISREISGQVDFGKVELRFFPGIRVMVHGGRVEVPHKARLSLASLQVGIKLLPLIRGKVEPSMVRIMGLEGWLVIPGGGKARSPGPVLDDETLRKVLGYLSSRAPGLRVHVQGEDFTLYWRGRQRKLFLSRFRGDVALPPDKLRVGLDFASPHVGTGTLKGWLEKTSLKGKVKFGMKGLDLAHLLRLFSLESREVPREALVNLSLEAGFEGLNVLDAALEGSIPCLSFKGTKELKPFMCSTIKARITRRRDSWKVKLDSLVMDYPRGSFKGEFVLDPHRKKVFLEVGGEDVDVPSVRKVVLALAGNHRTVHQIFEIVRGGRVPSITFVSRGARLEDLDHLDNMTIEGSLEGGTVDVPSVHLLVEDVGGKVLIQKGILHGQNLVGRLGNSRLLSGTLRVDLRHKNPFRLHANLDADLSQLPGVLNRVLKGGLLLKEIGKVKNARGKALGTLVVENNGHRTRVEVDAREVSLSCNYSRVPYSIKILEGSFSYRDSTVQLGNIRGFLGRSILKGLSAWVEWGGSRGVLLKVSSMEGRIFLDEIYPWITSYPSVRKALRDFSTMKGWLQVTSLTFQGPVSHPGAWKFRLEGGLRDFAMDFSLFPRTLRVRRGTVTMTPEVIAFRRCYASLLDATPMVTGSVDGYLQGVRRLELDLDGKVGPRAAHWIYGFIHLPREYRVKPPFTLKGVHVLWDRKGRTDFSGEVLSGGVQGKMDLEILGDLLLIRDLRLNGVGSSAVIGLTFQGKSLSLNFKGRLVRDTLDNFLEKNLILKGEVRGDFALSLILDRATHFSARGSLEAKGLTYLWGLKMPVVVDEAVIKARGAGLDIERATLSLEKSSVVLAGRVALVGDKFRLDMDLSSPSLDVEEIENFFGKKRGGPGEKWNLPLEGEIRGKVFSVFYKGYTWSPVEALVHLYPNKVEVDVTKALLCGISTPGVLVFSPGSISLDVKVKAHKRDFNNTLQCLFGTEHLAEGHFSIKGYLKASGREDPLAENSTGEVSFRTGRGRIYRFTLLSRILSIISVTEIFRGKLPVLEISKKGFAYSYIKAKGHFRNGVLFVEECVIDGNSAKIFASGKVNFSKDDLSLTVLVAPFKTLNSLISKIPILGRILTGKSKTLISVPVKVTGKLEDPKVTPMSPTSVGAGILGIVKRTIEAPVRIIAPNMGKEGAASGK